MSDRVRVDLAAHRRVRPRPGAHDELVEQTPMGDALVRELMRVQLGLALRLAAVVAVALGGLPLLFSLWPAGIHVSVAGMPLPWLLLGVVSFPFLAGAGLVYTRLAERNEADFAALVGRPADRGTTR